MMESPSKTPPSSTDDPDVNDAPDSPALLLPSRARRRFLVAGLLLAVAITAGIALTVSVTRFRSSNNVESTTRNATRDIPSSDSLNVVLLYADDWSWKTLGHLSDGAVRTPHLDRLAQQGVSFARNCVTSSICWQSRATLYTGVTSSIHQQYSVQDTSMYDKTVQWDQTLYPQLYRAGYHVGFFGKYHAPMPSNYLEYTFDQFMDYGGKHWLERDGRVRHVTDLNKEDALTFLRSLPSKTPNPNNNHASRNTDRFALTVSFFATHARDEKPYPDQYMPMNYSAHRYPANWTIPVPVTATQEAWEHMPWFFTESNEGRRRWRMRFDSPDQYQESMKRMYRMATEVDDAVGSIVGELESMGVLNETIIIFTSDNGNFHGEHGLADKWYPHEESIRVPLIVVDPRMPEHVRGTRRNEFTLSVDLAPTILKAADREVPGHMQGRDVASLYLNASSNETLTPPWRKDFFYEFEQRDFDVSFIPSVFALVTDEHKYLYWPQTGYEQLFEVAVDPHEQYDVFNTTHPAVVEQIKARYGRLKELSQRGYSV